jgi:CO/xanthine dehydrogenase FAD-binding subunit
MQDFEYIPARTMDEAVSALARGNGAARVLAGGTDLIVQLREGRRQTGLLVDIKCIPDLLRLSYNPAQGLTIGAAVPCYRIVDYCASLDIYPGLAAAVGLIGGVQIQGRATLGGNLCNASPAADGIPALIVHQALCNIYGPAGARQVAAQDFCLAPGQTVLGPAEFLVSINLPPVPRHFGAHYLRFIPRNEMDIAVAGAAACVVLDPNGSFFVTVRLALSAVAPLPLFVPEVGVHLAGKPVSAQTIQQAASLAREAARPIDDMRGTAAQRKHLSAVLARRVLETAVAQARKAG